MRHTTKATAMFLLSALLAGSALASGASGHSVSGGPTPMIGAAPVSPRVSAIQQGEPIEVNAYSRWKGNESKVTRPTTLVIRDDEDWAAVWARVLQSPPYPLPPDMMAVAIFLGNKEGKGYSAGIISASRDGDSTYVTYLINKPAETPQKASDRQVSSPWLIQTLPLASGRVRFISATTN